MKRTINECAIPFFAKAGLESIICDGDAQTTIQYLVLNSLLKRLENGSISIWNVADLDNLYDEASQAKMDELKALTPEQRVELATWLLSILGGEDEPSSAPAFLKLVIRPEQITRTNPYYAYMMNVLKAQK